MEWLVGDPIAVYLKTPVRATAAVGKEIVCLQGLFRAYDEWGIHLSDSSGNYMASVPKEMVGFVTIQGVVK